MPLALGFENPQQVANFLECNVLVLGDRYKEALKICEISFGENPSGITLENLLLLALVENKKDLIGELEKFVQNHFRGERGKVLLKEVKAVKAYLSGDLENFKKYALYCMRRGEAPLFLLQKVIRVLNPQRDWELTAWTLFYLHNRNPNDAKLEELLHSFILKGKEKSIKLLQSFINYEPRREYYLWLGEILITNGYYAEAVNILNEALKRYPDDRRLKKLLAVAYTLNFQPGKAAKLLKKFGGVPDTETLRKAFISLNAAIHNPVERERLVEVLALVYGKNPISLENALLKAYNVDWYAAVLTFGEALEKVLKHPSSEDLPYISLYWLTYERILKKPLPPESENKLETFLRLFPKNPFLLLVKAYNLALKGESKGVKKTLSEIDTKNLPLPLVPTYLALKVFAYGYSDKLVDKDIKSLPLLETLLYLYPLSRRAAEEFANRYLLKHPSKIDYELVSSAFLYLGDLALAERYTKKMLKLFPDEPDYLNTYAYIRLLREGRKAAPEVLKLLQEALKLKPNSPAILDSMGWAYYLMGNYTAAKYYLIRALKLYPKDPVENYHYAELLIKLGKPCKAKMYLKRALEGIYLLPIEPETGLEKEVKKLLEEVDKACKNP